MVFIDNIEEHRVTIPTPPPTPPPPTPPATIIGQSDKKDYIIKLKKSPGDTSSNISELRLYLGCLKEDDMTLTTSNYRLSVIDNNNQIYSAINPINPASDDRTNVLRYIIPDEDVIELTTGTSGIEIRVQLETSQDNAEPRTPVSNEVYVLRARIEYTRRDSPASEGNINFKVADQ